MKSVISQYESQRKRIESIPSIDESPPVTPKVDAKYSDLSAESKPQVYLGYPLWKIMEELHASIPNSANKAHVATDSSLELPSTSQILTQNNGDKTSIGSLSEHPAHSATEKGGPAKDPKISAHFETPVEAIAALESASEVPSEIQEVVQSYGVEDQICEVLAHNTTKHTETECLPKALGATVEIATHDTETERTYNAIKGSSDIQTVAPVTGAVEQIRTPTDDDLLERADPECYGDEHQVQVLNQTFVEAGKAKERISMPTEEDFRLPADSGSHGLGHETDVAIQSPAKGITVASENIREDPCNTPISYESMSVIVHQEPREVPVVISHSPILTEEPSMDCAQSMSVRSSGPVSTLFSVSMDQGAEISGTNIGNHRESSIATQSVPMPIEPEDPGEMIVVFSESNVNMGCTPQPHEAADLIMSETGIEMDVAIPSPAAANPHSTGSLPLHAPGPQDTEMADAPLPIAPKQPQFTTVNQIHGPVSQDMEEIPDVMDLRRQPKSARKGTWTLHRF
jgi:hypothetical protein